MSVQSSVRIVGGAWRGRKVPVCEVEGLRPTPDRVRETLFNWLMPTISGAVVLDICAGTGVLGLEALSRGASKVFFVEQNKRLCQAISEMCEVLQADAEVVLADAGQMADEVLSGKQFDLVFLDPPYQSKLYAPVIERLMQGNCFARNAQVYIETSANSEVDFIPMGWQQFRSKRAGDVRYELYYTDV
ncbi:MAG: 16S rRNA (guanine(966)-N(2))-methyltransferase RsmD [Proteobacteria bacterium]|jgi:16S rRNA (guanine966-N2)-methyltransferase|nr:16S rRNA (guanine(966)-N(2))-methyltransferase RsmD [Pseudomonadota bacterium]